MNAVRLFRGEMVEDLPDGKVADPFIMALVRHHSADPADEDELLSFLRTRGFQTRHLEILLKRFGTCRPLLASKVDVTTWEGDRMLRCNELAMPEGMRWREGALSCDHRPLPESLLASLPGRTLGEIVEHPYLPSDLVVDTIEQVGARWTARFRAHTKKIARQISRSHWTQGDQA